MAPINPNIQTTSAPLTNADQVRQQIYTLQEQLQQQLPAYEGMLQVIHRALHADPEVSLLLSEEEIGIFVAGLAKKKGIVIATAASTKGKTVDGRKLKDVTLEDI